MKKLLLVLTIFCMILPSCKKTTITLSVDKTEITANGVDLAKFKVIANDEDDVTKDARIFFSDTNEEVGGSTFSTTEPKTYSFYATYEDATSEKVTVTAIEVVDEGGDDDGNDEGGNDEGNDDEGNDDEGNDDEENPVEAAIVLTASTDTIIANGEDAITFTVTQDGNDVTEETVIYISENGMAKKLDGIVFTSTKAGSYKAYAKKDELKSNEIDIIVEEVPVEPEKPITLAADKTNIIADGKDAVTFTVTQDGNDVTNECEIYVNGSKLNDNKYVTYAAGSYKAYAKKGDLKSEEITITVTPAPDEGKTILFAEGVTPEAGWYDVNKIDYSTDINMCWAATSSNIIQWWQDRYMAAGNELPAGAISGKGSSSYELALMDMYKEQWDNSRGADASHGITWYFEGRNIQQYAQAGSYAQPKEGNNGGYFANIWNEILPHVYHDYVSVVVPDVIEFDNLITREYNGYNEWGNGSGLSNTERLARFSELLVEFMGRGVCGLGVSVGVGGGLHSTTLWGCEYDNSTGIVTKIWIADSDDIKSGPRTPKLHECTISMEGGSIRVDGAAQSYYITQLFPVSGYGSR